MTIICMTGGLASGKSTAAVHLEKLGAYVIDADILGHRAYDPGTEAFRQVLATFGNDIVGEDGQIDRKQLGGKVFGQPAELKKLTDIVWPEIRRRATIEIEKAKMAEPERVVVLEAAVLFEAGWDDIGDENWTVIVEPEIAIERSMARDNLPREAVENRLASQLSNQERESRSDHVIVNNTDLNTLLASIESHWHRLAG